MLVLTVDVDQQAGDLLQPGRGHGLVVDPADASVRHDFPGDDEQAVLIRHRIQGGQGFQLLRRIHGEYKLHVGVGRALADAVPGRLAAKGHADGADDNGFTGPRLAGEDI